MFQLSVVRGESVSVLKPSDLLSTRDAQFPLDSKTYIYLDHPPRSLISTNYVEYIHQAAIKPMSVAIELRKRKMHHFIYIGSHWQEPGGQGYRYLNEYALSKQIAQELLESLTTNTFGVSIVHLFDVFGERDPRKKFLSEIYSGNTDLNEIELQHPSDWISPIHVSDAAVGIIAIASKNPSGRKFNIFSLPGPKRIQLATLKGDTEEIEVDSSCELPQILAKSQHPSPHNWRPKIEFTIPQRSTRRREYENGE